MRRPARLLPLLFFVMVGCGGDDDEGTPDSRVSDASQAGNVGFAGCGNTVPFADRTGATDSRQMTVATVGSDFTYSPKCMRIKQGQSVSIESSSFHPLQAKSGNPGSEIVTTTTTRTVTLASLGVYAFYCGNHGTASGGGLAGAIEVVP